MEARHTHAPGRGTAARETAPDKIAAVIDGRRRGERPMGGLWKTAAAAAAAATTLVRRPDAPARAGTTGRSRRRTRRPRGVRCRTDGACDGRVPWPRPIRSPCALSADAGTAGIGRAHVEAHAGNGGQEAAVVVGRASENRSLRFRAPCRSDGERSAAFVKRQN